MAAPPSELLDVVRHNDRLCLNVDDPGWDDARGYLFDEATLTMYFPVAKKYLPESGDGFRVLIWSEPRVVVIGELHPARYDDDLTKQLSLAEAQGMRAEEAWFMLLDQRTKKPRRTRHKLVIKSIALCG